MAVAPSVGRRRGLDNASSSARRCQIGAITYSRPKPDTPAAAAILAMLDSYRGAGDPMDIALAVNRQPGRLWAFLQFPLTRIVIAVVALTVFIGVIQIGAKAAGVVPHSAVGVLVAVLIMLGTLLAYIAFLRVIECRRVAELGFARAAPEFGAGFVVGVLLFSITMLVLFAIGVVDISLDGGWQALGYPLFDALIAE